mgnify:CR=1 FL=1
MSPADDTRCPVCGGANGCGVARGKDTCWCLGARVAPKVLAVLAEAGIEDRCLCPACAAGLVPSPCVHTCRLDRVAGACEGCGRTLDEIGRWGAMDAPEQARVRLRLNARERP